MVRRETNRIVYVKQDGKWLVQRIVTDPTTIYKYLLDDFINQKYGSKFITRIRRHQNYDGTVTFTVWYDNDVKADYTIER